MQSIGRFVVFPAFEVTLERHIVTFSISYAMDVFVLKRHLNQAL